MSYASTLVKRTKVGKRFAYSHSMLNGRVQLFMPDQYRKDDVHNEIMLTHTEARRLAKALTEVANRAKEEANR